MVQTGRANKEAESAQMFVRQSARGQNGEKNYKQTCPEGRYECGQNPSSILGQTIYQGFFWPQKHVKDLLHILLSPYWPIAVLPAQRLTPLCPCSELGSRVVSRFTVNLFSWSLTRGKLTLTSSPWACSTGVAGRSHSGAVSPLLTESQSWFPHI